MTPWSAAHIARPLQLLRRLRRIDVDDLAGFSLVSRPLRRLAQRSFSQFPLGVEPVNISSLVYPLRYDFEVRMEFFTCMAEARARGVEDLVAVARASSYWTWFHEVVPLRNKSLRHADEQQKTAAFERRVRRSLALAESFERRGFDRAFPVHLRRPDRVEPTSTGKLVERTHYPVDGCHRMALLLLRGRTELQPGEYREERVDVLSPVDNTAILVRSLALGSTDYLSFLARGYGVPEGLPTGKALLAAVEKEHSEHLAEAAQVVAVDAKFLPPAEGGRHLA